MTAPRTPEPPAYACWRCGQLHPANVAVCPTNMCEPTPEPPDVARRVPERFSIGGDRTNAQKAWLDGYDAALRAAHEREPQCPHGEPRKIAENITEACPCSISTRHEWFEASAKAEVECAALRGILEEHCYKTGDLVAAFAAMAHRMVNLQQTCQNAGISVGIDGKALAAPDSTPTQETPEEP